MTENNSKRALLIASAALLVSILGVVFRPTGSGPQATQQSVYDRVVQSGTIRASYANYPPYCVKDPNSGKLSGIFVDTLNEAGRRLALKVEWVEEVGWGAIFEGLNSNRHDIFGAGIWRNSSRAKVGDFSRPLFFNLIKLWGRPNEKRDFSDHAVINDPATRIATLDGAIEDVIAKTDYPRATHVSVPQLAPWSDVLLNITSGKADITFAEPAAVNLYLEKNPGTLKDLASDKPIRVFANGYAFKLGEPKFKAMIDGTLEELLQDGTVDRLISKYEKNRGEYMRVARPYDISPN